MPRVFIIAEAGVNHNADLDLAEKMIDEAARVGANAIKFQAAVPEMVATRVASKARYQEQTTGINESQLDMIRRIHFPLTVYEHLKSRCKQKDIIFFASAFDLKSLAFLDKLGQPYHKIPSGEITNLPYLRQIGGYDKPIILSTGMASMGEIETAIEVLEECGTSRTKITVLHCTTEYPAPIAEINLRAMQSIASAFGVAVGYSDHTIGIEVAIAAVAMGAKVIEKHLTLDRKLPGPDQFASAEPGQFKEMVDAIRNIEAALGDGVKRPTSSELNNKSITRKSLVASREIKKGELFTTDNLCTKRPGTGISPMQIDSVLGRIAHRNFVLDELIDVWR
jgi:N,N'-diacetyllegionaminate synthase